VLIMAKSLGLKTAPQCKGLQNLCEMLREITCVLHFHIEQDKMAKLDRMNGHDTPLSEITSPILIRIFVIDPILQIIRE